MKKLFGMLVFIILIVSLSACVSSTPEKPVVEGVQEGIVYGGAIEITLKQREEDVDYIAIIDEEEYEFGRRYTEEGKHTLKVTASRDEQSSEMLIPFEIDSTPPKIPTITGVTDNEIYYDSVQINVEKEDDVTYEFMINEKEYDINTPFKEEGAHVFKVIATKERNNLTSEKELSFYIDNSTYSQQEVDYFTEIALGSEYGGSPLVTKWKTDVRIKVGGNPTEKDLETLRKVADELDALTSTLTLDIVKESENINIYFVPQGDFQEYIPGAVKGNWAYFRYHTQGQGEIGSATITIGTFGSDQTNRDHHIREELTQALGMGNDSVNYKDSIFYENYSLVSEFTRLDEKVVEILYREDIDVGMNKEEIMKTLKERITNE